MGNSNSTQKPRYPFTGFRLSTLCIAFLLAAASAFGQTYVTNSAATASGGNTIPFGNTNNKIEMTLGAGDLTTTPVAGYITKIYLRFTTSNSSTLSNFSIAMTQVAASSITTSTTFTTGLTTVFGPASTKITPTKSVWYPITLAKPFYYTPGQVLVVTMQHNGYTTTNSIGTVTGSGLARYRLYGTYGSSSGSGTGLQKCDFGFDVGGYGTDNAGVTSLVSPVNFCAGSSAQSISVKVSDLGTNDLSSVKVGWSFDGTTQTPVTYSTTIKAGTSATVTLGSQVFSAGVSHTLKVWTFSPNGNKDTIPGDDTLRNNALMPALSGTFTIDPSGSGATNFKTFAAAVSALNTSGVCGATVFNVAAGTYSETPSLGTVTGASATNTITFQGAGRASATLTSSGNTLTLTSSGYITFTQMTISTTGSSSTPVTYNGTRACSLTYCTVKGVSNGGNYNIYFTGTILGGLVDHCYITGNYYSIYINGTGGTKASPGGNIVISNNRMVQFSYYGMIAYCSNTYSLVGNKYLNNVVDSSANGYGYGFISEEESGATYNGNQILAPGLYEPFEMDEPNYYINTAPYLLTNNVFSNSQDYCYMYMYSAANVTIAHNTFNASTNDYAVYFDIESCISNINIVDNIFIGGGGNPVVYYYMYGSTLPSPFGIIDGNMYYNPGGGPLITAPNNNTYTDLATYKKDMASYTYKSLFNGAVTSFESSATTAAPNFKKAPNDLHVDQTKPFPPGVYAGIDADMDGDARCKLFPTIGADESNYGKSKPIVKFFLPTNIYPGSPTYIYQTAKAGEPKAHQWYLNGVKVSDSVVLFTNKFVTGTNYLKLVTMTCGGNDSFDATFTVKAPTAVPGTDFISNKNTLQAGDYVMFKDLSTNGPTNWTWSVSPDSTIDGGAKVATTKYVFGSANFQNPNIQFNYGGKYKVCLTATNSIGKGSTVCKTNYINVLPSVNLGSTDIVHNAAGYLYDNGGPNGNYNYVSTNGNIQSIILDPCADSVYLTLSMFDMYCGYDYLRIYEGTDNSGKPLWNSKCSGTGFGGYGPGYTGGLAYPGCTAQCMPNVKAPAIDTFRAKKTMYIEMVCVEAYNSAGFAAYWWSKPKAATKPKAAFISSNAGDSVCTNAPLNFTNTTKIDPNDKASFLWDLDGDLTTFECIGTCASASYPYFLAGPVTVTLIAANCGGSDTAQRTLTVYNPAKPKSGFVADNTYPTTNDVVFFTATVPQCVDNYKWSITPSSGTTGAAVYVNGTSITSAAPQVNFTGKGYYDVKLYVDNASGAQKDSVTIAKYIQVRDAYCVPSVATLNDGIGISKVVFNTISNSVTQASTEYSNFAASLSTTVAIGATYPITISRDPSLVFEPINRDVYIDWNQDGSFVGKGEIVATDSNSYSTDYTAKITVPKTAKLGATIMRIAVNRGTYANKPCGQNEFGEYHDYRLYVTPYNILPVITLTGHQGSKDTIKIEQGHPFVESGYKATSFLYGDMTKFVKETSRRIGSTDSFSNIIPGIYIYSYNVTDSAGNKAITQTRVVQVTKDQTPPALIVNGPDTTVIEVTKNPLHPVPVPSVKSADDLVDGPLAGSVIIDSGKVQTNIVGIYIVNYSVTDLSGNTAVVSRVVNVVDTIKPFIKEIGANPMTLEVYNTFNDPGVSITDNYYSAAQLNTLMSVVSNVDTAHLGTYTVSYNVTDPSGNKAVTVTRTVIVADTIAPAVSLIGNQFDSVDVFASYKDLGVSISDNYNAEKELSISISGTFYSKFPGGKNPNLLGSYTIIYTVTDRSGNKSSVTRTIFVVDHQSPVITLLGDPAITVCRWFNYADAGYKVSDNYDKALDIKVDSLGTYYTMGGTTMSNLLYLRYKATDRSGNSSYSDYRYIRVLSETDFTCENTGINGGFDPGRDIKVFPNPNAGRFVLSANIPSSQKVRVSVTNALGQEIAVVHNGTWYQNNLNIDLSAQPSGVYMLNIVTGNNTYTRRIEIAK